VTSSVPQALSHSSISTIVCTVERKLPKNVFSIVSEPKTGDFRRNADQSLSSALHISKLRSVLEKNRGLRSSCAGAGPDASINFHRGLPITS
jgi:hypothetical protein